MTIVHNTLTTVNGSSIVGANIEVSLSWDQTISTIILNTVDKELIVRPSFTSTDGSGDWTMNLAPNVDLTQPSLYRVLERSIEVDEDPTDDHGVDVMYYIDVPSTGTHWVGDLIVPAPVWAT